jgi:hypothetical protein
MRRTLTLVGLGVTAIAAVIATGASAVLGAPRSSEPAPVVDLDGVEIHGDYVVVDSYEVEGVHPVDGTPITGIATVLVPADSEGEASMRLQSDPSCSISSLRFTPTYSGGASPRVTTYATVELSSGCATLEWTHSLYRAPLKLHSSRTQTISGGQFQSDLRTAVCVTSHATEWGSSSTFNAGLAWSPPVNCWA